MVRGMRREVCGKPVAMQNIQIDDVIPDRVPTDTGAGK